ncbi:MAG: hypothetical protein ACXAEU_04095 [Candidatus Hodarchaeales archaeon]
MPLLDNDHENHENHLCTQVGKGTPMDEYKKLVKDGNFVCKICGRVAGKKGNLCDPVTLD